MFGNTPLFFSREVDWRRWSGTGSIIVRLALKSKLKFNAAVVAAVAFGLVNLYGVVDKFGGQAVDLSPALFLTFSIWVAVRNLVSFTCLPVAAVYLLGRHSRWLLIPGFIYVLLVDVGTVYIGRTYHAPLASEWLPLLMNTNVDESIAFIKVTFTAGFTVGFIAFAAIVVAFAGVLLRADYPAHGWRSVRTGVLLAGAFVVLICLTMNLNFGIGQMTYSSFILTSIKSWTEGRGIREACLSAKLPEKLPTSANTLPDCVIVLGESATRNSWHLYGYERHTTPRLDEICGSGGGGVMFSDVVGTQPATDRALALLLTDVSFDNQLVGGWTLAEVYKRAGYRCVLISHQWGGSSDSTTLYRIFNGCEKRISVRKATVGKERTFDEDAIPLLEKELKDTSRPNMIFIHLAGMHYPVQEVIPECEKHFTDEVEGECIKDMSVRDRDRNNRYDDAILYEDKVLGGLVDVLRKRKRPSCLMFISDHGESPRAMGWRDFHDREVYEVPMFIWLSPAYKSMFPDVEKAIVRAKDKPLQSDELSHGLIHLGLISRLPNWDARKDFLSSEFEGRNPRKIDKGRLIYERKVK